jgi:hypothetical protein
VIAFLDGMLPIFILIAFVWIGAFIEPYFGEYVGKLANRSADGYGAALALTYFVLFGAFTVAFLLAFWVGRMHLILKWLG